MSNTSLPVSTSVPAQVTASSAPTPVAASPIPADDPLKGPYNRNTAISEVISDSVFGKAGRLLFPVDTGYYSGSTLGDLSLTWYTNIQLDKTMEIVNTLHNRAAKGEKIFYDIYTDAEKSSDPEKKNTGLFFFKGTPREKVAVCNAGGGFAYVGAMHDSFPHALELSKKGQTAMRDRHLNRSNSTPPAMIRSLSDILCGGIQSRWYLRHFSISTTCQRRP